MSQAQTPFCAVCTSERGPFVAEMLDGRLVRVCRRCSSEHPRAGGYHAGGGRVVDDMGPRVAVKIARRFAGDNEAPATATDTPGG